MPKRFAPLCCEEKIHAVFQNAKAGDIVLSMAERIIENRAYLSEIDGKIGDGDHGVNMAKGFGMAADRLRGQDASLAKALDTLGTILMTEIGGSMGPLYGVMFTEFAEKIEMLRLSMHRPSAECCMPVLKASVPSARPRWATRRCWIRWCRPLRHSTPPPPRAHHSTMPPQPLSLPPKPAGTSTINLVAKIGRASRLGERSLGVLDAGATSCALILRSLAEGAQARLQS